MRQKASIKRCSDNKLTSNNRKSKRCSITHDNFYSSRNPEPQEGLEWSEWTEDEVQLVTAPTFHIGGAGSGIGGLYASATNVVLKEFEPTAVLTAINDYGILRYLWFLQ